MPEKKLIKNLDIILICIVLALVLAGVVFLAYATAQQFTGEETTLSAKLEKLDFATIGRQLLRFSACVAAVTIIQFFDYRILEGLSKFIYAASILLLLLVLALGSNNRGATAWFEYGDINLQPSEPIKLTVIVIVARIAAQACERDGALKRFLDIVKLLGATGILTALVISQNDLGTAFVYMCIMVGMLFAARLSWKVLISFAATGIGGFTATYFFLLEDWQQDRIRGFLNPQGGEAISSDVVYNVNQSKAILGSGQLNGKGFFGDGSLVQNGFLPEHTTDFIFSSGVEAFGFIGGLIIILLYALLLMRILYIAYRAREYFGAFLCVGVASMLFAHIFENIGMVMGVMPVTGIPLPFISYGGSNFLTNMLAVGLVLNVALRRPTKHYGGKSQST